MAIVLMSNISAKRIRKPIRIQVGLPQEGASKALRSIMMMF